MLTKEIIEIIKLYQITPIHEVALKLSSKKFPIKFIIEQIEGRQKSKTKLPTWNKNEHIIFPPKLNLEQSSSELTAHYKSKILSNINTVLDLTGGFGVDAYYLAQEAEKVVYVEQNKDLVEIVRHNFDCLVANNIEMNCDNSTEFLKNIDLNFSLIYLDPARRNADQQKLFNLADCQPNVIELLPELLAKGSVVMIKASPMLDLELAIKQLKYVYEIHIISVDNDCKEVIYMLKYTVEPYISIKTTNILSGKNSQNFEFKKSEEEGVVIGFSKPLRYLYEPNVAIMKSGAFRLIANKFNLDKLAPNTHIYTGNEYLPEFPGKIFEIKGIFNYKTTELCATKHNVVCRNFPYTPDEIKKTMKIIDGGTNFIFAMRDMNEKLILVRCAIIN